MDWLNEFFMERPVLFGRYVTYAVLIAAGAVIAVRRKRKARKEMFAADFELPKETDCFTIENQDKRIVLYEEAGIHSSFHEFLENADQFLTLEAPKPQNDIYYVQACHADGMIEVQLGIGNGNKIRLYHKYCSEGEALQIFVDFYNNRFVPERIQYEPVEFPGENQKGTD